MYAVVHVTISLEPEDIARTDEIEHDFKQDLGSVPGYHVDDVHVEFVEGRSVA